MRQGRRRPTSPRKGCRPPDDASATARARGRGPLRAGPPRAATPPGPRRGRGASTRSGRRPPRESARSRRPARAWAAAIPRSIARHGEGCPHGRSGRARRPPDAGADRRRRLPWRRAIGVVAAGRSSTGRPGGRRAIPRSGHPRERTDAAVRHRGASAHLASFFMAARSKTTWSFCLSFSVSSVLPASSMTYWAANLLG